MSKEMRTSGSLHAIMDVPGSKSLTNRALICAALAQGETHIANASESEDTALLSNALNQFGILVRREAQSLVVEGRGGRLFAPKLPIPVGNAGTTFRFLLSLAALARGTTTFLTSERMAVRPNDDLLEALRHLGATIHHDEGSPQFVVRGAGLSGGALGVPGGKSSQFLSSLLLAAPMAATDVTIRPVGEVSSISYVTMTLHVMKRFGAAVSVDADGQYVVRAPAPYRSCTFEVEPDASSASYPFAAAAIAGGEVFVPGIRMSSQQGDVGFLEILRSMGCTVIERDAGVAVVRSGQLNGVTVSMNTMPDVVPTLVAVALFAQGSTSIGNVGHLRYKESDRSEGFAAELRKLGADVSVHGQGLVVNPAPLRGALLETHDDHRLAMSFALVGLRVPGLTIDNPRCVQKSFPRFWQEFDRLLDSGAESTSRHTGISSLQ